MRHTYQEDFFSAKTLESCYWAGFIAGDGCILEREGRKTELYLELATVDKGHVEKIASRIGGVVRERTKHNKQLGKSFGSARWRVSSNKLADDLKHNFNILPAKSLIAEPPENLTKEQTYAFMAGLYDSDGHYGYSPGKRPLSRLIGTEKLMEWANEELFEGHYSIGINNKKSKNKIYTLTASGDRAIMGREKYINMELPFLDRKYRYWENNGVNVELSGIMRKKRGAV